MNVNVRDILFALSDKNDGDYRRLFNDIKDKKMIQEGDLDLSHQKNDSNFLTILDDTYPECFKQVSCPPIVLYYYGDLSLLDRRYRLTVIGSRESREYQLSRCEEIISSLEDKFDDQLVIVSGMARGIDSKAMRAAMKKSAPVISVLGCGIDNIYPKESEDIYSYCKSGKGLILSEYPRDCKANKSNFTFRNRLMAALSPSLLVLSGKIKSGSATTVKYALDLSKDIMALPCDEDGDSLTNSIIKEGAFLISSATDVYDVVKSSCDKFR